MGNILRRSCGLASVLAVLAGPVLAQMPVDDFRVRQLENEVQRLQRQVDDQARRITALEYAANLPSVSQPLTAVPSENTSPGWLNAASWDRLKAGMKVAEVIAVLGRPTSTRHADDGKLRLMYYAMELGGGSILSGTIRLEDERVVEINRPVLK
jgi:hypothetical protein